MGYSPKRGKVSWLFEYLELMLLILRSSLGVCGWGRVGVGVVLSMDIYHKNWLT